MRHDSLDNIVYVELELTFLKLELTFTKLEMTFITVIQSDKLQVFYGSSFGSICHPKRKQ